jgi:hypothetical protein
MFVPFARREGQAAAEPDKAREKPPGGGGELDDMKRRLEDMQKRIDQLTDTEKKA